MWYHVFYSRLIHAPKHRFEWKDSLYALISTDLNQKIDKSSSEDLNQMILDSRSKDPFRIKRFENGVESSWSSAPIRNVTIKTWESTYYLRVAGQLNNLFALGRVVFAVMEKISVIKWGQPERRHFN